MAYRKVLTLICMFICLLSGVLCWSSVPAQAEVFRDGLFFSCEPDLHSIPAVNLGRQTVAISADAAVLMDAVTGQVLYAKKPHQKRPIASTTKIMTALLAIECGNLKDVVSVSVRAAGVEGSSIYLKPRERLTLEDLIYGALMHSGNDACVAIAEHVSGSERVFVGWMNAKAAMLGLQDTNFRNTNGLPQKDHLSSAYDLAVITRDALNNPVFSGIVSTRTHFIGGSKRQRQLSNTNQMLWGYNGADGVKTGTTSAAGKCLVSSASRNGRRLIAVVLHSDDRYVDSSRLLDYGFTAFTNHTVARRGESLAAVNVADGEKSAVTAGCGRDIVVTVPVNRSTPVSKLVKKENVISAPVVQGQVLGDLLVLVDGKPVAEADLIAVENIGRLPLYRLLYNRVRNAITESEHKAFKKL